MKERKESYDSFLAYNIKKSSRDALLAGAYREFDPVVFVDLAHCHMENLGRCLKRKLKWGHDVFPPDGMRACDADGNLSITAPAGYSHFKQLKEWTDVGFRGCRVLNANMDDEEPSAASAISAAANKGQQEAP